MNSKWRWFTSLVTMAVITFAGFFLSNASNKQPRISPQAPILRAPIYTAGNFTFSIPLELTGHPPSNIFFAAAAEPEIKVDIFGDIYVTAIAGVPGGTDFWKSTTKGASFTYLGQPDGAQDHCATLPECVGAGGGDDSIDVSNGGYLYVSSLWLGSVTMSASYDGGTGGVQPGQKWEVNPAAATIPGDDRQWIAAYGPQTVYMSYTDIPTGVIDFEKSTDGGKTFGAPVQTYSPLSTVLSDVQGNMAVDQYNGNVYMCFVPVGASNQVYIVRSTDGGATFTQKKAVDGPAGTSNVHVFPTMAVDRGGNVHIAYSRCNTGNTSCQIYLASSTDQGNTWFLPVRVSNGAETTTAVEPTIAAGSPGFVDVTWLGSAAATPEAARSWYVFFAQTPNALAVSPTFAQNQAEAAVMHDQDICFNGLACAANPSQSPGNRDLLEYYSMAIDPDGNANIAYADSVNNCPSGTCITNTWYIKQTGGPTAYVPPAAPASATFSANIPVGSPGAEPSIAVDLYNCIYVTAPGNPWVWKSVNNGASFLPPVNPVADEATLTGGDEDIITLPKADGTRPDQVYFADLGLSTVHIRKSTDGGALWFKPGPPAGTGGDTAVSSDRQWLAWDRGVPTAADMVIYEWDHELASEIMRMSSLVNDGVWQTTPGMGALTDPDLATTVPNTNPGPVFVDKTRDPVWAHRVFGLFNGSVPSTNAQNPPFGKLLNVWEADGPPPATAGAPPGPFVNHHVFKGLYDSATNPPPAVGPPVGPTFGTNNANIFPAGDIDSAGNVYVAWSMNNARTNEFSIWFAASHDHGQTYYGPFFVSSSPMTADETAVFPWVAAGDNGRVDIIWYATTAVGDPNTITGSPAWKLYFAQSLNANSREPVFTVVQPNPANIIHNGQISTGGLLGSSDRSLLDFMEIAVGPDGQANIIFADNAGQGTRAEYTRQTGGPLALTSPTSPTCLPCPLCVAAIVSRKTHGSAGTFNIPLPQPPFTPRGVECRTGNNNVSGEHTMVFIFPNVLTAVANATVSSGTGTVSSRSIGTDPHEYIVNLSGVTKVQYITVTLTGVQDNQGNTNASVSGTMGVLQGDTTSNGSVNSSDISQTKAQSGTVASSSNFRTDVTVNGLVNSSDISTVKSKSGTALPQAP